jgi:3-oxoadipate enol-lactonase
MSFANLQDAKIYYEFSGDAHLPVLVFSNGLGTNLHMWDSQIDDLSKHFRVLRCDTRGHGKSDVTPGPYSIEQLSRDVVGLLDSLQLDRVYFCGISMGGLIGMFLGTNFEKRFHGLVLCSTAAKIGTTDTWTTRIQTVKTGGMKAIANAVLDRWFTPGFRSKHPAEAQRVEDMLVATNPEGYAASCAAVRDSDQRSTVQNIHVPCLVVVGKNDPGTPPSEAQKLAKLIAGSQYTELLGSHLCNIESRDEFNQGALQFLLA